MFDGRAVYTEAFRSGILPDPDEWIWEWADQYRVLPDGAAERGLFRTSRVPYTREIMECLSPMSPVTEVCVMKGTQLAFTTIGENLIFFVVHRSPGPIMMMMPSLDLAKDHSKDRLATSIEARACLSGLISDVKSRDSGNTILSKKFPGGSLKITGANSAKSLRSKSIRYLILDDSDGFDAAVGGEGDPAALARKRTDTYKTRKKIYENSTPTEKGFSRIEKSYENSDKRKYQVPCPHCGAKQELVWGGRDADFGIKFTHIGKAVTDVWYECRYCREKIDEHHKTKMLEHGEWVPENPGARVRGYHLSSLYSPLGWVSWKQIVEEFLEAGKNVELLKVWTNTRLAQVWETPGQSHQWEELKRRAEPYPLLSVPAGGLLVVMGVDVHPDRLEFGIIALGRGEECWVVGHGPIMGNPETDAPWDELDGLRMRSYRHEYGVDLHIACVAVDSGGHNTQAVYNYARTRSPQVIAIKGESKPGMPIIGRPSLQDVNWRGAKIEKGVQKWPVGSDTAKEQIYQRLGIAIPGPRMFHFSDELPDDFYRQMTAEKCVTVYHKGHPKKEWRVMEGRRNEALDCLVYAFAAAYRVGLARINWDDLEQMVSRSRMPEEQQGAPNFVPDQARQVVRSNYAQRMLGR